MKQHAPITVNGKNVDAPENDGIVVVIPAGVNSFVIERAMGACAFSSWVDGTGTTTLIFKAEHVAGGKAIRDEAAELTRHIAEQGEEAGFSAEVVAAAQQQLPSAGVLMDPAETLRKYGAR